MIADMLELVSLLATQSGEVYKNSSVMRKQSSVRAGASGDGKDKEEENGERKTGQGRCSGMQERQMDTSWTARCREQ